MKKSHLIVEIKFQKKNKKKNKNQDREDESEGRFDFFVIIKV
jgi:hypothetical protein